MKTTRKLLPYNSNLLGNIASAQEIQRIQSRALKTINQLSDKITEETGIQSSLDDQDIKSYIEEIIAIRNKNRNMQDP